MSVNYILYGADISYFTGKARAYLRYKDIPFEERPATREVYQEVIVPRVGWPVIPVIITPDDETLQDTSDIIDALESRYPDPSVYPEGPRQRVVALLLEVYGDEWLKIPAMHYRWNHNSEWIIQEFGRLSRPELDAAAQREVGERACRPFRGSLPVLGVTQATIPAVEASYEALLAELDAHFAEHEYLFGTRPSIGDFGLIGPLYAHQYRDPASGALMERLAPNVVAWVKRMMDPAPCTGEFLSNDAVPDTVLPVLRRMMREQLPVLNSTINALAVWLDEHGEEEVPRGIGTHQFTLERGTKYEVTGERTIFTFDQWMYQRPWDCYQALDDGARTRVRELLSSAGAGDALDRPLPRRVMRRHFKLVRERLGSTATS